MAKKRPTDPELTKLKPHEFAIWFLEYNNAVISRYIQRRLIPNRYEPNDIKAYMAERIIDILEKREAKGKPIENPRTYFGRLIDFWCIEYQRMHGYIFGMPKRPRNALAESEISKYGFVYLENDCDGHKGDFTQRHELSYVDCNMTLNAEEFDLRGYQLKGQDPDNAGPAWDSMMQMVLPEDKNVLQCLFKMNMSIPEAAKHLNIAISTAYTRRDRALNTISGYLMSGVDLNQDSWLLLKDVADMDIPSTDIVELFGKV